MSSSDDRLRYAVLMTLMVVAAAVAFPFALLHLAQGFPGRAAISGGAAVAAVAGALFLRRSGRVRPTAAAVLAAGSLAVLAAVPERAFHPSDELFCFMMPLAMAFLLGRRRGAFAVVVFVAAAAAVVLLDPAEPGNEPGFAPRFVAVLVLVGALSLAFEASREAAAARLEAANERLLRQAEEARELAVAAQAASRAKTAFLANVSHEIRTPMNGVLGMAELLRASGLEGEARENVQVIVESGRALLAIIDDILDLSKVEAGRLELVAEDFDLRALVASADSLARPRAAAAGLSLEVRVAAGVPAWLRGDPGRLRQVLLNLLGNAVKFTETGSVTLSVDLAGPSVEGEPAALRFEVRDTGVGIPADRLEAVFEPFTQADSSTTRRYGGTGLGLAISRRLVEAMGGRLAVESSVGVGSTFAFSCSFPRGREPPADSRGSEVPAPPLPTAGVPRRILVAEDNPLNQRVTARLLERLGYEVTVVADGEEAIEALAAEPYDLVLMDLSMPRTDGLEATAAIRGPASRALRRDVPIVAMTASAMSDDRERCLAAGMDDHIAKPVSLAELGRVVARHLAGRES